MSSTAATLAQAVHAGQRRALSRAITLVESTRPVDRARAAEVLEELMEWTGNSIRLGISGAPGVGKSTFIEALGLYVIDRGHRVAVLAVDPSSTVSGGSILADKTRMEQLARRQEAFIRPSPAGRMLGGVARRTREALLLCEAAGFDVIFVETVGVGQSETMVADMTDLLLLLMQPGGGDELQGIKRGIVELADLIVVNKADGELLAAARRTASDYAHALPLLRRRSHDWAVPVETCSALSGEGIGAVWEHVGHYRTLKEGNGELRTRRAEQAQSWLWSETAEELVITLRDDPRVREELPGLEDAVKEGAIPPTRAAQRLLAVFLGKEGSP